MSLSRCRVTQPMKNILLSEAPDGTVMRSRLWHAMTQFRCGAQADNGRLWPLAKFCFWSELASCSAAGLRHICARCCKNSSVAPFCKRVAVDGHCRWCSVTGRCTSSQQRSVSSHLNSASDVSAVTLSWWLTCFAFFEAGALGRALAGARFFLLFGGMYPARCCQRSSPPHSL